jgi:hypothetical protein
MSTIISEKTLLPISLLGLVISAAIFVDRASAKAEAALEKAQEATQQNTEYVKTLNLINTRLSRIEGRLGINPQGE